jgi:hypothetical protein
MKQTITADIVDSLSDEEENIRNTIYALYEEDDIDYADDEFYFDDYS